MAKRRGLNRDLVVQRAAELADAGGGPDEVTLTALAEALDIQPPSLYNHVDSLQDLRHALAVYGMRRLIDELRTAVAGKTGREALVTIAGVYRRFAHEHPGLYPLLIRAPDPRQEALTALAQELLQMLLLVLASLGLQGDDALHAVRGLRALLHGFVSLEAAGGFKLSLERDESFRRLLATYLQGLHPN